MTPRPKYDRSSSAIQTTDNRVYIPLSQFESSSSILMEPGITTLNFFDATSPNVDFEVSLKMLRERVKSICQANPWLAGRVIRDKKRHERYLCEFPTEIQDADIDAVFFSTSQLETISSKTSYPEITKAIKKSSAAVKTGYEIAKSGDRVTKISFLPIAEGQEYLLIFSLSHMVGDGHTYYKLMAMLTDDSKLEKLYMERVDKFEDQVEECVGPEEHRFIQSPWIKMNFISRLILGKSTKVSASYVDEKKIAKVKAMVKEQHKDDPSFFVSTNDIVTSSFAKASGADALLMAVNLRGRLQHISGSYAGNYETILYYDQDSFSSPDAIRKSLRGGAPYQRSGGSSLPSWIGQLGMNISFVTSWAFPTFDCDLHLWNSNGEPSDSSSNLVKLHLPLYEPKEIPVPMAIVFKPCKGKLAVLYFSLPDNDLQQNIFEKGDCLGENVNPEMFAT